MSYRTVVKLTALIVKKEGISDEEFQRNFVEHGKKAVPKMVKHGLIEYKQVSEVYFPTRLPRSSFASSCANE